MAELSKCDRAVLLYYKESSRLTEECMDMRRIFLCHILYNDFC